jgi:hypothetical protein
VSEANVTDKPILFSAPMVRAILAGRKTQTRRIQNGRNRFAAGDRLWVRETHAFIDLATGYEYAGKAPNSPTGYEAVYAEGVNDFIESLISRWRPAIFTPRWASRITLEVTAVRVERLQDISESDARYEGVDELDGEIDEVALCAMAKRMGSCATDSKVWFAVLWDSINAKRATWDSNPWVCVVTFKRANVASV